MPAANCAAKSGGAIGGAHPASGRCFHSGGCGSAPHLRTHLSRRAEQKAHAALASPASASISNDNASLTWGASGRASASSFKLAWISKGSPSKARGELPQALGAFPQGQRGSRRPHLLDRAQHDACSASPTSSFAATNWLRISSMSAGFIRPEASVAIKCRRTSSARRLRLATAGLDAVANTLQHRAQHENASGNCIFVRNRLASLGDQAVDDGDRQLGVLWTGPPRQRAASPISPRATSALSTLPSLAMASEAIGGLPVGGGWRHGGAVAAPTCPASLAPDCRRDQSRSELFTEKKLPHRASRALLKLGYVKTAASISCDGSIDFRAQDVKA